MTDNIREEREKPVVFIAEDVPRNLKLLYNILSEENYKIGAAGNGKKALEMITATLPDLILLDVMMPEMDGFEVAEKLQQKNETKQIPIIFLTAKADTENILKGFEAGAVDYITKPYSKQELLARIRTQLEVKQGREKIVRINEQLEQTHQILEKELAEAAAYIESMLPQPIENNPRTQWYFEPSSKLGGDMLGYNWLDEEHFAFFLLDVCGHGIGAALLGVTVANILNLQTLAGTDFTDPAEVLGNLNDNFLLKTKSGYFFSIWYGVYKRSEHKLKYSSAGHPPAILLTGPNAAEATVIELRTPAAVVGVIPEFQYINEVQTLQDFNHLYLYSDGVYEIEQKSDGQMRQLSQWIELLEKKGRRQPPWNLEYFMENARQLGGKEKLDDDFSILKIEF
ncbi:MAG: response regulator [bacterium]|nr:response regulator [bacterium]